MCSTRGPAPAEPSPKFHANEATIVSYAWTWGDGTTGSGRVATHAYAAAGAYTISLTITDGGGLTASASAPVTVATSTVDYEFYDLFNVPYGEWWDYRTAAYGDLPMEAECFNATSIENGLCSPVLASVPDVSSYPYTNWYPVFPGTFLPGEPGNNPMLYAPYRFKATGDDVSGFDRAAPVFLPVFAPTEPAGARLDFEWRLGYLDSAVTNAKAAEGCNIATTDLDGFQTYSTITLTMDLQESKRIFGVVATDAATARSWWASNIAAGCFPKGGVESRWETFMIQQGGSSTRSGAYDVVNSFEWWYQPYWSAFTTTVGDDGTTTVLIDHGSWATEVLLARWFYWGSTKYFDIGPDGRQNTADDVKNYLDSTRARGWWGMELGWFDDFTFRGRLNAAGMDFTLTSAMQYHFQETALPGPDGQVNQVGDVPLWSWGPILSDYVWGAEWSGAHPFSELERYLGLTYLHSTPGSIQYGLDLRYEYVPLTWDLKAGQTWMFRFPSGPTAFHDPNLTPKGANPVTGAFVQYTTPFVFAGTFPIAFGAWDAPTATFRAYGPVVTGGAPGSPGSYPLQPYPAINFRP